MSAVRGSVRLDKLSLEQARQLFKDVHNENELANVYAIVENRAWYIEDDVYDYEPGTTEYLNAKTETAQWFSLAFEIKNKIFEIHTSEGISIPDKEYLAVLEPFMERNGYYDGSGGWIKKKNG